MDEYTVSFTGPLAPPMTVGEMAAAYREMVDSRKAIADLRTEVERLRQENTDWEERYTVLLNGQAGKTMRIAELEQQKLACAEHGVVKMHMCLGKSCPHMTPLDMDIVRGIAEGLTYRAIGLRVNRSPNTIRNRVGNLYKAFNVNSQAQLALLALSKAWEAI